MYSLEHGCWSANNNKASSSEGNAISSEKQLFICASPLVTLVIINCDAYLHDSLPMISNFVVAGRYYSDMFCLHDEYSLQQLRSIYDGSLPMVYKKNYLWLYFSGPAHSLQLWASVIYSNNRCAFSLIISLVKTRFPASKNISFGTNNSGLQ